MAERTEKLQRLLDLVERAMISQPTPGTGVQALAGRIFTALGTVSASAQTEAATLPVCQYLPAALASAGKQNGEVAAVAAAFADLAPHLCWRHRPGPNDDTADFRERHGVRPTASEMHHEGYNPRAARRTFGSWFGFVEAMKMLGVERRAFTAGNNKALLDPFSPLRDEEVEHVRGMLENIHNQFVDVVRRGRGDRIKSDEQLFSGLIWTGEQGVALGLVDELASAGHVAREVIGEENVVDFTPRRGVLDRLARRIGTSLGRSLALESGLGWLELR